MSTPLIELSGITQTFRISRGVFGPQKTIAALAGVDLSVMPGEVLGIVGESGSGKTTLARIMLGLQRPTTGNMRLDGRDITTMARPEIARIMQPVFQDPYSSLNPRRRIADIVRLPLDVQGTGTPEERRRRALHVLEQVGLPARYAEHYPNQLSGGQRQRVAIARALATNPKLVICDEPTSALDVSVQSQILNLLMDLQRDLGLTYVLISHNLAVVEHIASRVAVMNQGRIVEMGPTAELFARPQAAYTRVLLSSVLTAEPGLGLP
jgi:peptide/nickel transport system ATP-binding protein